MVKGASNSSAAIPAKPVYEVVSPVGKPAAQKKSPDARSKPGTSALPDLHGKKIGLIWVRFNNGNVLLEAFRDLLAKRFNDLDFTKLPPGRGLTHEDHPDESIGDIAREAGIDAAIVTVGG